MNPVIGLLMFLIACVAAATLGTKSQKIRLEDVQVLTLHVGAQTTGRRSSPVPQLQCVGGSGAGRGLEPSNVQCYNRESDGLGIQWQCKADMEATVKFGTVEVNCEGYDYPEDDYILAGSCALKYKLELTKAGKQQKYEKIRLKDIQVCFLILTSYNRFRFKLK